MKKISNYIFPLLIILLTVLLAYVNYVPGTILSGWDTLHPEFNFGLYLKRIFWGVWQEHQGLGAVAAQAHASELTRLPLIFLLDLILPMNLVRYVFFFICYGLGGLGAYFLSNYLISQVSTAKTKIASFFASTFYMLNLAALQHFYVPLEMFAVHYATLPFLLLFAIKYLREGKKNILWFSLLTVFSSSMAHTATLFYAYLLSFGLFVLVYILLKSNWEVIKRGVLLVISVILLNAFWLAPNIYYVFSHNSEVANSKIHQVFSDEAFLQSKSFGGLKDLSILKNFLFNWRNYDFETNSYVDLLHGWKDHLSRPGVIQIGYIMTVIVLLGLIVSIFKKSKSGVALLPLFVLGIFFLVNENPPFTGLFSSLRESYGIFREALRFPFTKFSIILLVPASVYFGYGINFLLEKAAKIKLSFLLVPVLLSAQIFFMLPAFKGDFVSKAMKVQIPEYYFEAFEYFNKLDPGLRVLKLPLSSMWGWNFYPWGYEGAGFTWFGIPQATLDREFDRWGKDNESAYRELSYSWYVGDMASFERTLDKYDIDLIFSESKEKEDFLNMSKYIRLEKEFEGLKVYSVDFEAKEEKISAVNSILGTDADLTYFDIDNVFTNNGNYYFSQEGVSFPFSNLDARKGINFSFNGENIEIRKEGYFLSIPRVLALEKKLSAPFGFAQATNGDLGKLGTVTKEYQEGGVLYSASGGGASIDYLDMFDLEHSEGYLLRIKGKNIEGRSLKVYLYNPELERFELEELMPRGEFDVFLPILPKPTKSIGYVLNVETRSYGGIKAENLLTGVEVYELPFEFITNLHFGSKAQAQLQGNLMVTEAKKILPWFYTVSLKGGGVLTLSQAYEDGWTVVEAPGAEIAGFEHVRVNSWKNGWVIPEGTEGKYYLVFWPQLLELGGITISLLALILASIIIRKT